MKRPLPYETDQPFLVFAATGTDLMFNRGMDLPGFALFGLGSTGSFRLSHFRSISR